MTGVVVRVQRQPGIYPWSLGAEREVGEELLPLLYPLATGSHPEPIGHAPPKHIAFMKS